MKSVVVMMVGAFVVYAFCAEPRYIGSDKCAKMCHKGEKKGSQYEIWQKSRHAGAFMTLGTQASRDVAAKAEVSGDPQKAPQCLRCHVTAFGVDGKLVDSTCTYEEGVGCEACHGPGSEYRKLNVMKNSSFAHSAGLVEQNEAVCIRCHNKESPTYKPFNYVEDVKKDAHPSPKKKAQ